VEDDGAIDAGVKVLYLDCFAGISGDMTVGALCDLGVPPSVFEWELSKLEGLGELHLHFERVNRSGITAVKFDVHGGDAASCSGVGGEAGPAATTAHEHHHHHSPAHGHEHSYAHEHGHGCGHEHAHSADDGHCHAHGRSFREIREMIERSDLSDRVKGRAINIFKRIAVAEGRIHGVPTEEVHFHEVGAVDSIADIVCACVGIEHLGVDRVTISPLTEGHGFVDCAHGRFPLPAPATLEILQGVFLRQSESTQEMITPTGAGIVREFAASFGIMPEMRIEKVGYGAGTRNPAGRPNVLRAVLGWEEAVANDVAYFETDTVAVLEANIDDLNPEVAGSAMESLLAAGAFDVAFTPLYMKKNRPGFMLIVVCTPASAEELAKVLIRETSTFGVRLSEQRRLKLHREVVRVATRYGEVEIKIGRHGDEIVQVSPEYESCLRTAKQSGQSVREIYSTAIAAWHASR
jgi:uncharacterized protein (TIGR00299 family) protein